MFYINMIYIERELNKIFEKLASIYKIIAVVGPRQAGKTTFLKEKSKNINANYIFFDDPDSRELFEKDVKKFEIQYLNKKISVLDEVQYCKDAGPKLKYLADSNYNMWLTSSSEVILSKDILSYLVGRVTILKLYPFSLEEYLRSQSHKELTSTVLKRSIYFHCIYGGYPKVVTTDDVELKKIILKDLTQTMVLKDVARNFNIEDISSLEKFVKYLSYNYSNLISYNDITSNLGLSFQTLKKYLDALQKSYLIKVIQPFYKNKLKEISKQPKLYFYDTGLRNSIANEEDLTGELFENYVFTELTKKGFELKYWRTKTKLEVDFIIEKEQPVPVEVKLKSQSRPTKGLKRFIDLHKVKKAFIVNYEGVNNKIKYNDCEIINCDIRELIKKI